MSIVLDQKLVRLGLAMDPWSEHDLKKLTVNFLFFLTNGLIKKIKIPN